MTGSFVPLSPSALFLLVEKHAYLFSLGPQKWYGLWICCFSLDGRGSSERVGGHYAHAVTAEQSRSLMQKKRNPYDKTIKMIQKTRSPGAQIHIAMREYFNTPIAIVG